MTGLRAGASGQSHSMIRSKNWRTVRIRCRLCLGRDRPAAGPVPGGQPHLVILDVITADGADRSDLGVGDHPGGKLAQRALGRRAGRSWDADLQASSKPQIYRICTPELISVRTLIAIQIAGSASVLLDFHCDPA
jgi:hypothetical protein